MHGVTVTSKKGNPFDKALHDEFGGDLRSFVQ